MNLRQLIAQILSRVGNPRTSPAVPPAPWSRRAIVDLSKLDQQGRAR